MIHVILFQPEIPPNTGNVIRLCANTGAWLHLIEPIAFSIEDKQLRRAGLDYHDTANLHVWPNLDCCLQFLAGQGVDKNSVFPMTTKGSAVPCDQVLTGRVAFLFGAETKGLPVEVRELFPVQQWLRLPMRPDSRSLNLSNSVAVMVYTAWQQQGFSGAIGAE